MLLQLLSWALLAQSGECSSVLERARAAYESRKFEAAAAEFERATTACPNPNQILLPLAQAQLMAQRLEPSLGTLERLLNSEAGNTEALKLRGDVLYLLGRETEAEAALRAALKLDPRHVSARYALGRVYYQESRYSEALEQFRTLLEQDPGNYRAHDNLALCYVALSRDGDALRHFLKALDLVHQKHPEYDTVYANAANFFLERQEYEKAFQLAAEAAKRNPASARNFFLTGKALAKLEKHDLSIKWLKQAAELNPSYAEPQYWLAQVYRKLEKAQEADAALQRFREINKAPRNQR